MVLLCNIQCSCKRKFFSLLKLTIEIGFAEAMIYIVPISVINQIHRTK